MVPRVWPGGSSLTRYVASTIGDESVGIKYAINGLLSLTPDGLPLLGETPEVPGLWSVAASWIKEGPGIGRAAAALFAQQGFAGVGREEIVARAGVTRGAMYHYFPSKEDLFQAVYETVEQDLLQAVAEAASADTDPVSQLRLGTEAFLRSAATEEIRRISLIDAPAVLSKRTRRQLDEQYGLTAVHAAGRLRVGPPAVLAPLLLAAMHEAATQIADGAAAAQIIATVDDLIGHITAPP